MADSNQPQQTRTSSEEGVKSPNVIEGAKEVPDAVSHSEESPKHDKETHGTSNDIDENAPNVIEGAKEEPEALSSHSEKSPKHDKETHGTSDDIDENTPVDEVKGPSILQRMKEEIEAFVESVNAKKDSD